MSQFKITGIAFHSTGYYVAKDTIDENDTKTINRSSKAADSAAYSQLKTSSKNAISELKARIKELEGQLKESR